MMCASEGLADRRAPGGRGCRRWHLGVTGSLRAGTPASGPGKEGKRKARGSSLVLGILAWLTIAVFVAVVVLLAVAGAHGAVAFGATGGVLVAAILVGVRLHGRSASSRN